MAVLYLDIKARYRLGYNSPYTGPVEVTAAGARVVWRAVLHNADLERRLKRCLAERPKVWDRHLRSLARSENCGRNRIRLLRVAGYRLEGWKQIRMRSGW